MIFQNHTLFFRMKKILILTNRIPFPLNDGGNKAVYNTLEFYIEAGYDVHLLSMNTSRHFIQEKFLPPLFNKLLSISLVNIDNSITVTGALKALIKNKSYHLSRYENELFQAKLIELLNKETFDIIQLEGLFVSSYLNDIKKHSNAKIIYRQHNIEYKIWEKKASSESSILKKIYYSILSKQLKKYEFNFLQNIEIIFPISNDDLKENAIIQPDVLQVYWPYAPKIEHVEMTKFESDKPLKMYHIGAMDWIPNQEAVEWLLDELFPSIKKEFPHIELHIAGRNMPEKYFAYESESVKIHGEVEDSMEFIKDKHILIIPLKSASGQRIKFIEAIQNKKCILSTDVGKSDIEAVDKIHYLRANVKNDFINQIRELYSQLKLYNSICENAFELFLEKYSYDAQFKNIIGFINKL